jgi:hypothetical protein
MGGKVEEEGEEVDESDQSLFALSADDTELVPRETGCGPVLQTAPENP